MIIVGRPLYEWTISGNGFSFDGAGKTTAQTNVPSITVYSETGSCGSASITVTDECTSVTGYVRATTGKWGAYQSTTDCNRFSDCDYGPNVNFTGSSHPYSTGSDWTICGKYLIRERGCVGSTWSTCSSNRHYRLTQCMDPTDYQCVSDAVSDSDHCQKNRPRIETYWPFNSYYFCPVKDLHIYGPTGLAYRYFMVYKYYYRETNYREWVCQ